MDKTAVAGVIVGGIGSLAAVIAAYFGWKAPTKEDLARVEAHVAGVNDRLAAQHHHDLLVSRARRVSIEAKGSDLFKDPLNVTLVLRDTSIPLIRIDLLNEEASAFGEAACTFRGPGLFVATIENAAVQSWFSGGVADGHGDRKRLLIRAVMLLDGQEAYRDFVVRLVSGHRPTARRAGETEQAFILEGRC